MRRTLFTITMILGLCLPHAVVNAQPVQGNQTFTSVTTGIDFDLGSSGEITFLPGDYEIRDTPPVIGEYVWFTYHGSNFQVLLIGGDNDTLSSHDATMGNMIEGYDSWTVIAEELEVDYSWFIGEAELDGETIIVLYSFELDAFGETDLMIMQFAVPETLQRDLEFVQGEVTIGGNAFLPHIDAGAVAVVAGVELATDQPQTTSQSPSSGWESLGLISDAEWQSPNYGTRIFWDISVWEFPHDFDLAIVIEGEPPFDSLALQLIDGSGYAFVSVVAQEEGDNPESMAAYWTSDQYLANVPNGATLRASVVTNTSAMIVYETISSSTGEARVVIQEATYLDNGVVLISEMWGTPSTIDLVYGDYILGIHVDGEPFPASWTVEDVGALFGF